MSTTTEKDTMTAWVYRKAGSPTEEGVLVLETDFPKPVPKKDEILIQVKASSLNVSHSTLITYLLESCTDLFSIDSVRLLHLIKQQQSFLLRHQKLTFFFGF